MSGNNNTTNIKEKQYHHLKKDDRICSVTIDVTPFIYTKSDRYFKIIIENNILKKGSIAYDKYITK